MPCITFKRITPEMSRIYDDDGCVGDVYRQPDILNPGAHYYVLHLIDDYRGPVRVHERSQIRAEARRLVETHPLW